MNTAILVGEVMLAGGLLAYICKALVDQMADLGWVNRRNSRAVE